MANKIDTLIDAVQTKLEELVTAGTVKAVEQKLHDPMQEQRVPLIGIVPLSAARRGGSAAPQWVVTAAIRVLARCKASAGSGTLTELIAAVQAKLDALSDSGTFGAALELGNWELTYHFQVSQSPVAAAAMMKLTFEGNL